MGGGEHKATPDYPVKPNGTYFSHSASSAARKCLGLKAEGSWLTQGSIGRQDGCFRPMSSRARFLPRTNLLLFSMRSVSRIVATLAVPASALPLSAWLALCRADFS